MLFVTMIYLITDLALQPGIPAPAELFGPDKVQHISAFFVLTLLARMAWPRRVWVMPGTLLAYGIWIEWAQALEGAGRTASGADIAADLIGITIGALLANLVTRLSRT
ncbi:VanZ family protein [uncultured Maricaulis sp.]|uniref:VanZ family protein n=1 Tax=uncultured Maricaulis sp. TaxID=174710 RepID=UPI0030D9D34C